MGCSEEEDEEYESREEEDGVYESLDEEDEEHEAFIRLEVVGKCCGVVKGQVGFCGGCCKILKCHKLGDVTASG